MYSPAHLSENCIMTDGTVTLTITDRIATISFAHPKGNSLPGVLLKRLTDAITGAGAYDDLTAVILQSSGNSVFCAGASFNELLSLTSIDAGTEFFNGFANVILAIRACPCPVITRVQGKTVGGGVGILAASDYTLAAKQATVKLSELHLGFGPYVIEPAIRRRIGSSHLATLALSTDWQDSQWAERNGLFNEVYPDSTALDAGIEAIKSKYRQFTRDAVCSLKKILWEGTSEWTRLLPARAEEAARLVMRESTRENLQQFFEDKK